MDAVSEINGLTEHTHIVIFTLVNIIRQLLSY